MEQIRRVITGIKGLDEVLKGGFPFPSAILVGGEPGTGKTTFCLQSLFGGAAAGEKGIYISGISEPIDQIQLMMAGYSFYDRKLVEDGTVKFMDVGEVLFSEGPEKALDLITSIILKEGIKRAIIDPLTPFSYTFSSPRDYRKFLHDFFIKLKSLDCLMMIVVEGEDIVNRTESFMCDGIILFYLHNTENPLVYKPGIQIRKMRGTEHTKDILRLGFTKEGMRILEC
jgi:circadian clock protein KaiC